MSNPHDSLVELAFGADSGIDEESLAEQLREVIRGEDVTIVYDGDGNIVSKKVTTSVRSKGRGLLVADRLLGGSLGLTRGKVGKLLTDENNSNPYSEFAGQVDDRLVRRRIASDG